MLQLSHQWTWVTSKNATHRTPRSPSLSHDDPVAFFHPLSLRTFPPSALCQPEKSALLASLAQNDNLISKTSDHSSPHLFFYSLQKKIIGISGSTNFPLTWFKFVFFPSFFSFHVTETLYVHSLSGRDWFRGINCWHSPQDTKDCSLKYKPCSLLLLLIWFWRKMRKGWLFFSFSLFWKIVGLVNCRNGCIGSTLYGHVLEAKCNVEGQHFYYKQFLPSNGLY